MPNRTHFCSFQYLFSLVLFLILKSLGLHNQTHCFIFWLCNDRIKDYNALLTANFKNASVFQRESTLRIISSIRQRPTCRVTFMCMLTSHCSSRDTTDCFRVGSDSPAKTITREALMLLFRTLFPDFIFHLQKWHHYNHSENKNRKTYEGDPPKTWNYLLGSGPFLVQASRTR